MAKRSGVYKVEKRRKEIEKKRRKEEKRARRQERKDGDVLTEDELDGADGTVEAGQPVE